MAEKPGGGRSVKYIVIEIQTFNTGAVATNVFAYDLLEDAEAKWHTLMAGAAKSSLPIHAASIMTADGCPVQGRFGCYRHLQPEPEVTEENNTQEENGAE